MAWRNRERTCKWTIESAWSRLSQKCSGISKVDCMKQICLAFYVVRKILSLCKAVIHCTLWAARREEAKTSAYGKIQKKQRAISNRSNFQFTEQTNLDALQIIINLQYRCVTDIFAPHVMTLCMLWMSSIRLNTVYVHRFPSPECYTNLCLCAWASEHLPLRSFSPFSIS